MSLYDSFHKKWVAQLQKTLWLKNINEVPHIEKVVVSMGIGSLATKKWVKDFSEFEEHLQRITGQLPQMVLSKSAVSNFKLREGMPSMLMCTLRGRKAYDFLERLNTIVFPRQRDFRGLPTRSFDGQANLNLWFKQYDVFPEIGPDDMKTPLGIQVTMVTTTPEKEHSVALLKQLGFVIAE